jgi:hypothetical protein
MLPTNSPVSTLVKVLLFLSLPLGCFTMVHAKSLPRVLIIGDSVSMGYTDTVVQLLRGTADVRRPDANCGATFIGLRDLDKWLGGERWDLIHFNFGLHDLRYCFNGDPYQMKNEAGEFPTEETGAPRTPIGAYEANLRELVRRMQATGAQVIWGNTTPVTRYFNGYEPALVDQYNQVAARVMAELGVSITDLNAVIAADATNLHGKDHVHPNYKGARALAKVVADAIKSRLSGKR